MRVYTRSERDAFLQIGGDEALLAAHQSIGVAVHCGASREVQVAALLAILLIVGPHRRHEHRPIGGSQGRHPAPPGVPLEALASGLPQLPTVNIPPTVYLVLGLPGGGGRAAGRLLRALAHHCLLRLLRLLRGRSALLGLLLLLLLLLVSRRLLLGLLFLRLGWLVEWLQEVDRTWRGRARRDQKDSVQEKRHLRKIPKEVILFFNHFFLFSSQNGPALHATPAPMCAVIFHVTRGPSGRLARVGVQSRVEWCFHKWAEVFCSLTCVLEAHTKITILAPSVVAQFGCRVCRLTRAKYIKVPDSKVRTRGESADSNGCADASCASHMARFRAGARDAAAAATQPGPEPHKQETARRTRVQSQPVKACHIGPRNTARHP